MSNKIDRLDKILDCMDEIDFVIDNNKLKITQAIENRVFKSSIRMNIVKIAEQFNRLKDDSEFELLSNFEGEDLKGINAVRNYIAHDYDSVDDEIIENAIRDRLPKIRETIKDIKNSFALEEIRAEMSNPKENKAQETNTQSDRDYLKLEKLSNVRKNR